MREGGEVWCGCGNCQMCISIVSDPCRGLRQLQWLRAHTLWFVRLQLGDADKLEEKDSTAPAKTNQGRALDNVYRHWNIALRLSMRT